MTPRPASDDFGWPTLKVVSMKDRFFGPDVTGFLSGISGWLQVVGIAFALVLPASPSLVGSAHAQEATAPAAIKSINELAFGDVDIQKIAAIVNDNPITEYDVYQRMAFIVSQAGFQLTEDDIAQMREQILRTLIDETLKLEEALTFEVSPRRKDVDEQLQQIASQNNLTIAQIEESLGSLNIGMATLERQIMADLVWNEIVSGRFRSSISITDEEINAVYQRTVANANKPQYRVFEIFYRVDSPEQEAEIRNGMLQLVDQIKQGADFRAIAQQISYSPSATQGGDIGWVQDGQLPPELNMVIRNLKPGEVSQPIRSISGYYLLLLAERRMIGGADPMKTVVTLQQLIFPMSKDTPPEQLQAAGNYLFQASQAVKSCDDLIALQEKFPTSAMSERSTLTIGEVDQVFQTAVIPMQAGEASAPILTNQGFHIIGLCDREDVETNLPDREQIEDNLANQQITMMARRYLRDLRNDAVVEMR